MKIFLVSSIAGLLVFTGFIVTRSAFAAEEVNHLKDNGTHQNVQSGEQGEMVNQNGDHDNKDDEDVNNNDGDNENTQADDGEHRQTTDTLPKN